MNPLQQLRTMWSGDQEAPKPISVLDIVHALELAKDDPRIIGIVADMSTNTADGRGTSARLGFAQAHELRTAMQEFYAHKTQTLGKEGVVCMALTDTFDSQAMYYLATGFQSICMQPQGSVPLTGIANVQVFAKELLDRLGVVFHSEARTRFKTMVMPFTAKSLTDEQTEHIKHMLRRLNTSMMQGVVASRYRGGDKTVLEEASTQGPYSGVEAMELGLVDVVGFARTAWQTIWQELGVQERTMKLKHYLTVRKKQVQSKHTVGVVYLVGTIKRSGGTFHATAVRNALEEAGKHADAVVLRIDSGGGDVLASDIIGETVHHVQKDLNKPVVASFGNVAASGGYYVATDCKRIFASPLTITGSIGVAALRPHITPVFYDKFGLNIQSLIVNGNTTNDMTRPLEGKALELYRRRVDAIYESFVSRVSQGRQLDMEKVKAELAGGRVFSGTDALENGLVDAEGGVMQAIREASRLSNKEGSVDIQVFPRPKPFLERLAQAGTLEDVASGMLARIVKAAVVKAVQESAEEGELVASIGHFL